MRCHFAASLLVFGMVGSGHGSAFGADADALAADEQTLRTAKVGTDGTALLDFFRKRTATNADRERIHVLLKQLGNEDFDVREKASAELVGMGPKVIALVRPALKDRDPEIARRAEDCLRRLEQGGKNTAADTDPALPAAAARLVASRKPAGAAEVLLGYAPFADDESVSEEIETALVTVAVRDGKAEPALTEALTAEEPLRRGLAGAALARARVAEQKGAIRKLLKDPDLGVRLHVGLALAGIKDKEAVPVLIDLLGQLPPAQVWPVEDLLRRLGGEKSPMVSLGTDAASQGKCRDAWAAWWRDHGAAIELPALAGPGRALLGYTLIVTPDAHTITELGRDHKPRWQVSGLRSPFDAQVLPGDRILVAEYAGYVTERNLKGDILWEKQVPSAMQCQRLANGNTFVVTVKNLLEIDPTGKERVIYTPNGTNMLVARKLPSGDIIAIVSDGTCMRLDATGKELSRFAAGNLSNNCLDVLPNGHILVSRFLDNKVTEYDARGKVVWEIPFLSPFSAHRLPNGNTLMTRWEPAQVVEVDRAAKAVWEYKPETPNGRAWFASRR